MRRASRNLATLVMGLILVLVTGCIPAPGEITPTPSPEEVPIPEVDWGIIEIRVTDPGVAGVISAIVTAENISIHKVGGGWVPIVPGPVTFDLVELAETEGEQILGEASIATANFTGIRMDVTSVSGNTTDNVEYTAEVPSDKLRIVRPFNVERGLKTTLTLDFDLTKSLIMTGAGKFLFKPVLHVKVAHSSPPGTGEEAGVKTQEKEREKEKEAEGQEFEGTIKAIDGDDWTVTIEDEDWKVDVSEAEIEGEPEEGLEVEIKGTVVDDTIMASEVEIEEEEPEKEKEQEKEKEAEGQEFEGTIKDIDGDDWTVTIEGEDWKVDVSEAEIEGEPEEGLEAEIKGTVVDGTIVASEVEIEEAEEEEEEEEE